MSLSIGIVGLPNVGKSTLFKVLTKKQVDIANYPFCTIDPSVGVVEVPDERVKKLAEFSKSKKVVPAVVEFVDIAGLVKGASEGEGLGNKFLANIREVDAIAQVVRVFKNDKIIHVHNEVNPQNDIGVIETELILADLETATKRVAGLEREAKTGNKEAVKKLEIAGRVKSGLEAGKLARDCGLSEEETLLVKDMHLLSLKPILYVYNMLEGDSVQDDLKNKNYVALDIKTEEDMADMSAEDKKELGVESKINNLIVEAYKLLGLMNFFTTGEDETRAWTIKQNSTAPEAGVAIHTDFREKFIRADVIGWQDLLDTGSYAKAREKGLVRTEGKEYIVKDGDVIEFRV
ncbi:TPA: redox-regulated ATPase YchF [Patescibacteria group bacterium]|nr:MAG: GTP-binding protein YchF [Parcubacteria group bacterium GW2011_GWF2_40_10]KKR47217.1 MAG: GTP-binding protein YchF [Parcubacteria group bacterium GW2011_GWA2_40_143]KKR60182.1 MAG: GTP-binding protein YchF [Parcubacteria group bacterium GW2011_GWC2_40_31]KKR75069.1 MAG: GTP-binding protein YchF [Parcubacteria group bacterium GW2011_GWB2_40_8]KKR77262.1 MAG: GTP-binding protein YchF [Parcubacteria group bacterium GW2011_GWE2_40_8]KKR83396.1 MAG: GTP-binding protein YchF [Parcubacteria g